MGFYCYCIIDAKAAGLPGEGDFLTRVCYKDIALIVEDMAVEDIIPNGEALLKHERILEQIIKAAGLVPIRFGSILKSENEITSFLTSSYRDLRKMLRQFENKIEVGLKILWTPQSFAEEIEDKEIKSLKQALPANRAPSNLELAQIGRRVAEKVDQARSRYEQMIIKPLRPFTEDIVLNAALLPRMILNVAILLETEREHVFETELNKLYDHWKERLIFQYTGPWPPYNFVKFGPGK